MLSFEGTSFNNVYAAAITECAKSGEVLYPKGDKCRELRPAMITLFDPTKALYTGKSRRLNYCFLAIECLSYIAGWGDNHEHAELMIAANSQYKKYLDDKTGLLIPMVCYGLRFKTELPKVYDILKKDPDSRQAVASIYGDATPCTVSLQFMKHGDALDLLVNMRSNDLNWGTPYDVASFCAIQMMMASLTGLKIGYYCHVAGSLHYYDKTPPIVNYYDETYIDMKLPSWNKQSWSIDDVQLSTRLFLLTLNKHVVKEKKSFSTYECKSDSEHWLGWQRMINFSWKK
jgi:thymidylate synthase